MATTPLSPSRVKAFPHNADLLGSTSEVSSHSTSRRASPLPESAPVEESPPPRIRRRTSLHESIPFDRSTVAPDLHHFDNYPRGAINNLGPIEHLRRPSAPRQVSYGTSSSEEYTPAPVTAPRQVSSNRRIPATTSSYPATQPLSQLFMMYGTTGEGLAGNEVTTEPTVPPPRSSWRDSVPNFSPERRAEPEHAPMARSTSIGTAFRHRMLRERMARLDALRTMPNHPEEGERRLFGAPTTMNPAPDSMEVDDIGRWNQGVQEALARRLESPRSPLSTSRRREGGPNRREQAEALWGEMGAIPVDTATSGLHDMFHPRAPPVAGPSAAQDTYRRYRLPRAFESPEQRTVPSQTSPYRRPEVEPEWRGVYRGILGWDGPDTEHNTPSSTSRSYMPGTLLGTYRSGRTGTDSGSSDTQRSFRPDIPTMSRWASYTEERDPTGYTNLHAPIYRRMHLRSDMPMEEKVLMAKAVCRGMSRWPIEIRRKTAEEMVEKVAWGEMGVREGMERDECCSICHDEVSDLFACCADSYSTSRRRLSL